MDDEHYSGIIGILQGIGLTIGGLAFGSGLLEIFLHAADSITRISIIPFAIIIITLIIRGIIMTVQGIILQKSTKKEFLEENEFGKFEKLENVNRNLEIFTDGIFFTFWFGFLVFADFILIKERIFIGVAFTSIFWLGGIYVAISRAKKRKN